MLSSANGSNGIVLTPSPKSPETNCCRMPLIASRIHSLGFGVFREHVFIVDAKKIRNQINILFDKFKIVFFFQLYFPIKVKDV